MRDGSAVDHRVAGELQRDRLGRRVLLRRGLPDGRRYREGHAHLVLSSRHETTTQQESAWGIRHLDRDLTGKAVAPYRGHRHRHGIAARYVDARGRYPKLEIG